MLRAGIWGLVAGSSLLVGALLGLYARPTYRVIGLVMAFGSGVFCYVRVGVGPWSRERRRRHRRRAGP